MWSGIIKAVLDSVLGLFYQHFSGPKIDEVVHADPVLEQMEAKADVDRSADLINRFDSKL